MLSRLLLPISRCIYPQKWSPRHIDSIALLASWPPDLVTQHTAVRFADCYCLDRFGRAHIRLFEGCCLQAVLWYTVVFFRPGWPGA